MFWPCETRTSTCRSFATISSGLYRFLAIAVLLDVKDIPQVGPLQWGWIKLSTRLRCAMACLPFESPKLAVVAQVTENDIATILDRRIARYQQMNQIAAANNQKVINGETTVSDRTIEPEPTPSPPTPSPLRRLYSTKHYRRI